jgi:hypothetical protein
MMLGLFFHAVCARRAGGIANKPNSFAIGADPGHHEHRRPSTSVPTEAAGADRRPKIDRAACAAAWAVQVEPWHAGEHRRPDCRRPQHLAAAGELFIPSLDDGLRLDAYRLLVASRLRPPFMSSPRVRIPMTAAIAPPTYRNRHQPGTNGVFSVLIKGTEQGGQNGHPNRNGSHRRHEAPF